MGGYQFSLRELSQFEQNKSVNWFYVELLIPVTRVSFCWKAIKEGGFLTPEVINHKSP